MTNCSDIREHLPVHADGELAADLRATADAHLTTCQACRSQLQRWQALRRCTQRVIAQETLPAGLEHQVRTRLRKPASPAEKRAIPLFGIGLAAAAAILFAVVSYWPQGAGQPSTVATALAVSADDLATIYLACAVEHRHDAASCRHLAPAAAAKLLARKLGFEPLVPDLTADGYFLDGACQCLKLRDARTIHVYYRSKISQDQVVSLFSVDRPVRLQAANPRAAKAPSGRERVYEMGHAQNVSVAKWDERGNSFALCAQMDEDALLRLAQSPSFARLLRDMPTFARLDGP